MVRWSTDLQLRHQQIMQDFKLPAERTDPSQRNPGSCPVWEREMHEGADVESGLSQLTLD